MKQETVSEFMSRIGRKGALQQKAKASKRQLSAWGKKGAAVKRKNGLEKK